MVLTANFIRIPIPFGVFEFKLDKSAGRWTFFVASFLLQAIVFLFPSYLKVLLLIWNIEKFIKQEIKR